MLVALYFICGLILLYYGADFLVKGGCNIAVKMKVPNLVIGLTLIAYGTSAPELVVSVDAAAKGLGDVSLGNVVGSNTCNIALILGLCAVITPLQVNPKLLKFDMRIMIVSALLLFGFYALNNGVDRWEAAFFLICCIIYTVWSFFFSRNNEENAQEEIPKLQCSIWLSILMVIGGLAALVAGAKLLVNSSVAFAHWCGISEAVIGLTVVAIGTSLPELATSVVAAIKKEQDIAIGNVVGSNIFNILGILGIAPLFTPIKAQGIGYVDILLMSGGSIFLYFIMKSGMLISRKEGVMLLITYITYTAYLVFL
jgi:cation:H+ antiporter